MLKDSDDCDVYYNIDYKANSTQPLISNTPINPLRRKYNLVNIFFYTRMTDSKDDEVLLTLEECIRYVLERQKGLRQQLIGTIYLEQWVYDLLANELTRMVNFYSSNSSSIIQIWPVIRDINTLSHDTNKLLQQPIDIIYCLGGDGTLLSLLKRLYEHYSQVELPPIAAINFVSEFND